MGLIGTLIGTEEPRRSIHAFKSGLMELALNQWTRAQFDAAFGIQAGAETTKLNALLANLTPPMEHYPFPGQSGTITLGTAADANAGTKSLGTLWLEVGGITKIEWRVRYNKIGAASVTWEIRNETDAATSDSFTDTGGVADNRENGGAAGTAARVITLGSPMAKGTKIFRLRVFGATAGQTVNLYGWQIRLYREAVLDRETVHEVLMAAAEGKGPNTTEAQVDTRLGI